MMARLVDAGFRCIGYKLPNGCGDGAKLGQYKHPHYVADLIALLSHLKIEQADLIGSSFKIHNPNATASCGCGTSFSI